MIDTDDERWPRTVAEAEALQRRLAPRVERADRFGEIRLVAGVDVGYDKASDALCAGVVVLDATTLACVDSVLHVDRARFPYVPGLFSFRELPPLLRAFERLATLPDLVVCDGHGIAHPRRFGLACHLGVTLDLPSIGCAKTPHHGRCGTPGTARGSTAPIVDDGLGARAPRDGRDDEDDGNGDDGLGARAPRDGRDDEADGNGDAGNDDGGGGTAGDAGYDEGETIGAVVRTRDGVKPLYVSVGHRVSLETAVARVLDLAPRYRQPETTRLVDALVNARVRHSRG